jgi:NAD(P)-dependent dehydrogenase (short-subunit alcohol dehydrogenase family)
MSKGTILVTGASRGIGKAISQRLYQDGYRIVGTYNSTKPAASSAEGAGGIHNFVQLDCGNDDSIEAIARALSDRELHGIVNNAGMIEFEDFRNFDLKGWRRTFAVNLDGVLKLTLALNDRLGANGSVVNIASTDGFIGGFDTMAYAASKAAVINLTKSLAINLGPKNIRVNAVAPGWIQTDMGTKMPEVAINHTALGRLGLPEEIAGVVSFLISSDSSYITGETIVVDGGYYCIDPVMKLEAKDD